MMTLELTAEEDEILRQILETSLAELRIEILNTDRIEFKEMLRQRKAVMMRLQEKLERRVSSGT